MAKFHSKLSKREVEELFYKLSSAISEIKSVKEAADFLRDLLSYQEAEMIAKRLKIAELLLEGKTYAEKKGHKSQLWNDSQGARVAETARGWIPKSG